MDNETKASHNDLKVIASAFPELVVVGLRHMGWQEPEKEAVPITDGWLDSLPQFEQCGTGWWYTTKETPDSPSPHDVEIARHEYGYRVTALTDGCESQLPVKTVEALVGFLRLCGLDGFAAKINKQ